MFGKRLVALRKQKGISQYKLAADLGLSRGQLGNYELGYREPDFDTLLTIAEYFNVTTDYLLGFADSNQNEHYEQSINDMAEWLEIIDLVAQAGLTVQQVKQVLLTNIEIAQSIKKP